MDESLETLAGALRATRGFDGKRDIATAFAGLDVAGSEIAVGDDCAAIPDPDGYTLFAIEGFIDAFVAAEPWFAGYCGVMVNLSDVAAMGGRATAVVDALWAEDEASAGPVFQGLKDAAARYGVPIVGGHTNARAARGGLAVAVLGRAARLITSFDAAPGDDLVMAIDLRGAYRSAASTNWDASTAAPAARLRADLAILPEIAEAGLCRAGKDISMAGAIGTAAMLLEASGVGAAIDPAQVPRPEGADLLRWLSSFPSFGFVLSVRPDRTAAVLARFAARGIASARVGAVEAGAVLRLIDAKRSATVWDFAEKPLIGCGPRAPLPPRGRRWPDGAGSDGGRHGSRFPSSALDPRGHRLPRSREGGGRAMTPLRIALLTHSTNPRGGVSHCLSLAEALVARGHEAVVHAPDPARRGFFRVARCGTVTVPACRVESRSLADMVEQRIAEYWDWFSVPCHRGFDVYHAHDGIGANALADLAEAALIPAFVRTVHHLDAFADPQVAARQDRGVRAAATVLCVSDVWCDEVRRLYGVIPGRVANGVDRSAFSDRATARDAELRAEHGLGDGPVVLSVGGFEPRKNSLLVIDAFARLRERHPAAQLVVVGGASVLDHAAYASRCRERLRELGLPSGAGEAVVITGPVPQDGMAALYRLADVLAFPSLAEGFGLAVIEAQACGTPAVVSRIAPFTEYLGAADAVWADPADAASIAEALAAALDPAGRAGLVARGHAVAARHDWASSAGIHIDRYRAHLAGSAPVVGRLPRGFDEGAHA